MERILISDFKTKKAIFAENDISDQTLFFGGEGTRLGPGVGVGGGERGTAGLG